MFKSTTREIVIPQSEHLKLAGTLASFWGNEQFDSPEINRLSFIAGIALHDRGYGFLDQLAIGRASEQEWLAVTRKGFYAQFSDPVADLITRLHLRRLVSGRHSPERGALLQEMGREIHEQIRKNHYSREKFERIDRITNLCDRISFDFCFERPTTGSVKVFPRNWNNEQVSVNYALEPEGEIKVAPWPFSVETFSNYLVGYRLEGYPNQLDPVIVASQVSRGGK